MTTRQCLKCGHLNAESTGSELEPCPACGAIYSRVEATRAAEQKKALDHARVNEGARQDLKKALRDLLIWGGLAVAFLMVYIGVRYQQNKAESRSREQTAQIYREEAERKRLAQEQAIRDAIDSREVFIGMTAEQAEESWGKPKKINRTITTNSVSEQWVYDRGNFRNQYLYLTDGVVRSIQSPE